MTPAQKQDSSSSSQIILKNKRRTSPLFREGKSCFFLIPILTGAGRLVIKDVAILAGAVVLLSQSAKAILARLGK